MSTVKFECPVCNQNMECERARSGDVIHCPGCGAQIRVPFHNTAELDGTLSRAELVTPAPQASAAPSSLPAASHDIPPAVTHHEPAPPQASVVECPACHTELKVVLTASAESVSAPPVHKAQQAEHEP